MKTTSINEALENKFGYKDKYELDELKQVNRLILRRFDVDGELLNVDFKELQFFQNLEELTIKNCILDNNIIKIILNLPNLKKLLLFYCEIVDDIKLEFQKLNIDYLVIEDTNLDLNVLKCLDLNKLVLANIKVNTNIDMNTYELDIQRCLFDDIKYFNINQLSKLKISYSQYKKDENYLNNYIDKLIIMEDNGQFVHMENQ